MTYDPSNPNTAGGGKTVVRVNPASNSNSPTALGESLCVNGSPGKAEPDFCGAAPTTTSTTSSTTTSTTSSSSGTTSTTTPAIQVCVGKTTDFEVDCNCSPVNEDCRTCSYSPLLKRAFAGTCTQCKNAAVLYQGQCLQECPEGFEPNKDDTSNFGRECEAISRRRRLLSVMEAVGRRSQEE
eukprot:m.174630 g.174630  ORF g.174630 m.174630 type:complete len:182 (+) comp25280_c2_seq1:2238-2783(+)